MDCSVLSSGLPIAILGWEEGFQREGCDRMKKRL